MSDTPVMPELPEPVAHMYPSDLERFASNETFAQAYSVAVGNPDERSVPLHTAEQLHEAYRLGVEAGRKGYADLHAAALAVESRWIREGQHCVGGAPVSIFMLRQALGGLGPLPSTPAQEDKP